MRCLYTFLNIRFEKVVARVVQKLRFYVQTLSSQKVEVLLHLLLHSRVVDDA